MPDRVVAPQAGELPGARNRMRCFNGINDFSMAVATRLLGDVTAVRLDLNIVLIAAGGEKEGMPEAVRGLRRVFADQVFRRVTAVAARDRAVRRLEPAVELFTHDVAVRARRGVVGHVGPAVGVGERVGANADGHADRDPEHDAL